MTARYRKSGFTLVEILIVVVILGILAAIVIPQFSSASESARASSLKSTLQTVRSQLELFQVQHNGAYPEAMGTSETGPTWTVMTTKHKIAEDAVLTDGIVNEDGDIEITGANRNLGPYLQKFPANPFANGSVDPADHWWYDETTGRIAANVTNLTTNQITELGLEDTTDFAKADPFASSAE